MKKYLVKRTDDDSLHLIGGLSKDPGYTVVGQAPPEAEDASDLDIVTDTDEMGTERTRIVVNATKRTARLEREAQAKLEAETKEAEKLAKKTQLAQSIAAMDPATVKLSELAMLVKEALK